MATGNGAKIISFDKTTAEPILKVVEAKLAGFLQDPDNGTTGANLKPVAQIVVNLFDQLKATEVGGAIIGRLLVMSATTQDALVVTIVRVAALVYVGKSPFSKTGRLTKDTAAEVLVALGLSIEDATSAAKALANLNFASPGAKDLDEARGWVSGVLKKAGYSVTDAQPVESPTSTAEPDAAVGGTVPPTAPPAANVGDEEKPVAPTAPIGAKGTNMSTDKTGPDPNRTMARLALCQAAQPLHDEVFGILEELPNFKPVLDDLVEARGKLPDLKGQLTPEIAAEIVDAISGTAFWVQLQARHPEADAETMMALLAGMLVAVAKSADPDAGRWFFDDGALSLVSRDIARFLMDLVYDREAKEHTRDYSQLFNVTSYLKPEWVPPVREPKPQPKKLTRAEQLAAQRERVAAFASKTGTPVAAAKVVGGDEPNDSAKTPPAAKPPKVNKTRVAPAPVPTATVSPPAKPVVAPKVETTAPPTKSAVVLAAEEEAEKAVALQAEADQAEVDKVAAENRFKALKAQVQAARRKAAAKSQTSALSDEEAELQRELDELTAAPAAAVSSSPTVSGSPDPSVSPKPAESIPLASDSPKPEAVEEEEAAADLDVRKRIVIDPEKFAAERKAADEAAFADKTAAETTKAKKFSWWQVALAASVLIGFGLVYWAGTRLNAPSVQTAEAKTETAPAAKVEAKTETGPVVTIEAKTKTEPTVTVEAKTEAASAPAAATPSPAVLADVAEIKEKIATLSHFKILGMSVAEVRGVVGDPTEAPANGYDRFRGFVYFLHVLRGTKPGASPTPNEVNLWSHLRRVVYLYDRLGVDPAARDKAVKEAGWFKDEPKSFDLAKALAELSKTDTWLAKSENESARAAFNQVVATWTQGR